MKKESFMEFYAKTLKPLAVSCVKANPELHFSDNPGSVYEEYLNQRTIARILYKGDNYEVANDKLLDRHKVCACMTVAIVKTRPLSLNIDSDDSYAISSMSRVNEQLAFMSSWELFLGFICSRKRIEINNEEYQLPETYHNQSFLDTITRSLFIANQVNALSVPILSDVFFLLEKYYEKM